MGSVCAWMAPTDARERIRALSVTMIGPSVYLVRLGTYAADVRVVREDRIALRVPMLSSSRWGHDARTGCPEASYAKGKRTGGGGRMYHLALSAQLGFP